MKNKIFITSLFLLGIFFQSCQKGFLDVSENLAGQLTKEKIFNNAEHVREWYANVFSNMGNSSNMLIGTNGMGNPWPTLTDELKGGQGPGRNLTQNGYNAGSFPLNRWDMCYTSIRQANIFLENAKPIPRVGSGSADYIDKEELKKMKAQVRFMRAYYHWMLFQMYGPIPIDTIAADPSDPNLDFARNSVNEVVNFIYNEITSSIPGLEPVSPNENHNALPTQGAALALRAKVMVYAASPLYNGGYQEAMILENKDGKKLFPQKDEGKWKKALDACQAFIDFAKSHYHLFKEYNSDKSYNPDLTLYDLFFKVAGNPEVIWANSAQSWGALWGEGIDRRCTPRTESGGFENISVDQSLVDAFYMNDGLSIDQSPEYKKNGFSAAGQDTTGRTTPGTFNMWVNREPRFYQTVFYQGRKWPVSGNVIMFEKGSGNDNSSDNYPWSGYLLFKRISRSISNVGSHPQSEYRPSIIFRLAEFYLLYAESLNEVDPGNPKVVSYLDSIRIRAGIPAIEDCMPQIIGQQQAQREEIRHQMRVELCTEGQRYFDVRRWMIANKPGSKQGGAFYGMDMNGSGADFYQIVPYENRTWKKAMYLAPIPLSEMQKSNLLVQNPGW